MPRGSRRSPACRARRFALQQGNRKLASTIYAEVAADTDLAKPYRDLALVRGTALEFDTLKPDEVIARLQPLAVAGEPFFGSAGEMIGMALLAKGQKPRRGAIVRQDRGRRRRPRFAPRPRGAGRGHARGRCQRFASHRPDRGRMKDYPRMTRTTTSLALLGAAALLSGCGVINKKPKSTPTIGDRVSVLVSELDIAVDPETAATPMALPPATANADWAQSGGSPAKLLEHVALGTSVGPAWSSAIGAGSTPLAPARRRPGRRRRQGLHHRYARQRARA